MRLGFCSICILRCRFGHLLFSPLEMGNHMWSCLPSVSSVLCVDRGKFIGNYLSHCCALELHKNWSHEQWSSGYRFWTSPEEHNRGIMPTYPSICRTICKTVAKQTNKPTKVWQLPSGCGSGFGPAWESRSWILHLNLNPNPSLNLWRQYNNALDMCTHGRYRGRRGLDKQQL